MKTQKEFESEENDLPQWIFKCLNKLFSLSWLNKLNKQTDLKAQHNLTLIYFVYMWRTLPPFQLPTVFWDLVFLWEQLVYSLMEKINISWGCSLIH